MKGSLIVFLSPGRSGTQWMANGLREFYSEEAEVVHEPVAYEYRPKITLRNPVFDELLSQVPILREHICDIEKVLISGRHYIEAGWPLFSWVPYFYSKFQSNLKIVHLTRHPVHFACSLATHGFYQDREDDHIKFAQLEPGDVGTIHKEYKNKWPAMSVFEKCLYQWLEIHEYALEVENTYRDIPYIRFKMEDLVCQEYRLLQRLCEFIGFREDRLTGSRAVSESFDGHKLQTHVGLDIEKIRRHPAVISLAAQFGYDAENFDEEVIIRRYCKPWFEATSTRLRKQLKKVEKLARRVVRNYCLMLEQFWYPEYEQPDSGCSTRWLSLYQLWMLLIYPKVTERLAPQQIRCIDWGSGCSKCLSDLLKSGRIF